MKFELNSKVWSERFGVGLVTEKIENTLSPYKLKVKFYGRDMPPSLSYTLEGKYWHTDEKAYEDRPEEQEKDIVPYAGQDLTNELPLRKLVIGPFKSGAQMTAVRDKLLELGEPCFRTTHPYPDSYVKYNLMFWLGDWSRDCNSTPNTTPEQFLEKFGKSSLADRKWHAGQRVINKEGRKGIITDLFITNNKIDKCRVSWGGGFSSEYTGENINDHLEPESPLPLPEKPQTALVDKPQTDDWACGCSMLHGHICGRQDRVVEDRSAGLWGIRLDRHSELVAMVRSKKEG